LDNPRYTGYAFFGRSARQEMLLDPDDVAPGMWFGSATPGPGGPFTAAGAPGDRVGADLHPVAAVG